MDGCSKKNPYFFCITLCSPRTQAKIAKKVGVVYADNSEDAEKIVWERYWNDTACEPWVEEIPEDGYCFTVFKSEI